MNIKKYITINKFEDKKKYDLITKCECVKNLF